MSEEKTLKITEYMSQEFYSFIERCVIDIYASLTDKEYQGDVDRAISDLKEMNLSAAIIHNGITLFINNKEIANIFYIINDNKVIFKYEKCTSLQSKDE